jgi:DnaJ family protein C protein 2
MDEPKRKMYDSSLPFDESIPTTYTDDTFYDLFEDVFRRNAIFSKKRPVPNIGTKDTDMKKVDQFYKFWFSFDTWRDFCKFNEYNTEEAGDRYEKRFMERENRRITKKYEKAERSRLVKLVDTAYEADPRVRLRR